MAEKWLKTSEAVKALGLKGNHSLLQKRAGNPYGFLVYGEHWRIPDHGVIRYEWNIEAVREALEKRPDAIAESRRKALHQKYLKRVQANSGINPADFGQ